VPYRIDISCASGDTFDRLIELGALDIEQVHDGFAAILPDGMTPDAVTRALGVTNITVSSAVGRDNGSVWLLNPRPVRLKNVVIAPAGISAPPGALRLMDSTAFGSGHHPTTALCLEAMEETLAISVPDTILDVGTGSGVLALAALTMGVPRAVGVDINADALKIAETNARLNNLADRLQLVLGGPDAVEGTWPVVVANVLAAPLIEMAPVVMRRMASHGRLILSGIPWSLESEVGQTYRRLGLRHIRSDTRAGWSVLVMDTSW
jgi:ribosomal protein L11 methyltransferase